MTRRDPRALLNLLTRLETMRHGDAGPGKRQFARWVVRGDAELLPVGDQMDRATVSVQLRDVSWGGLGFICSLELPAQSIWRIHFLNHGYVVGHQTLIVRHCRQVEDGLYLVGTQIVLEPGMLTVLGVDPAAFANGEYEKFDGERSAVFLAPGEVA